MLNFDGSGSIGLTRNWQTKRSNWVWKINGKPAELLMTYEDMCLPYSVLFLLLSRSNVSDSDSDLGEEEDDGRVKLRKG
jgi:hypothetical protein